MSQGPGPAAAVTGPARLEVELDAPGRHFGQMWLPYSSDRSAYGRIVLPVVVLNGGPGPTLLATGGVHGDEYEGQIGLMRLAHLIDPSGLRGRLILVPRANPAAAEAARRCSPLDSGNLARSFPGRGDGGPTQAIAEGISRLLLPLADALVDLHSGGGSLEFLPCAYARLPGEAGLARRVLAMLTAFDAPDAVMVTGAETGGTLVAEALGRGIPAIASELGGGGTLTPTTLRLAIDGMRNLLAHLAMADGPAPQGNTRLLGIGPSGSLRAPGRGLFEPCHSLGDQVRAGEIAGWLWQGDRPDLPPEALHVPADGVLLCRRFPAECAAGDVLVQVAQPTSAKALLG